MERKEVVELDGNHAAWLENLFASQAFMGLLGVEVVSFSSGRCELSLEHRPDLDQHSGVIHAGAIAALADNAAGGAASTLLPVGSTAITTEFKINFVAPARGERIIARAEVVHAGDTLTVSESRVYAATGDEERLCAVALVTLWPVRMDGPTSASS